MSEAHRNDAPPPPSRRQFMRESAAMAAAGVGIASRAYAGGSDVLRVGLIGCGGRGSGAAANALQADPQVKLVAMGDVFADHLKTRLDALKAQFPEKIDVDKDHRFVGFDAYKGVIESSDVVLLASTPHFRPRHLKAAVEAGKHVFCEKPVAVDGPGVRSVLESSTLAAERKLSLVSGLCWRYHNQKNATMQRVLDGDIGDIVSMETTYNAGGVWDPRRRRDQVNSEMEYQLRNWYYYTWLSGDHIVEQAIHSIDKMNWAMRDKPPLRCWGTGGRQVRTDPKYGNIYDHFAIVYEYSNHVRGYHTCRHWPNTKPRIKDFIFGTKGMCDVFEHRITGPNAWRYRGPENDMYQNEHDRLFAAIRSNEPINNGTYMCHSTLLAIMGRMAAYTGQIITWEDALNSKEDLSPPAYAWNDIPLPAIARPGLTTFS